ncbi:MAG TPA: multiprotein bridging factor aMBF1 [Candidatus Bathyarchaeia archaeon]|nr:multiprotein bridging factor aMBF1 [Candidatus Bathyarchaeia archaeon]
MSSFCELCGHEVIDEKKAVLIDGIVFNVCRGCSKRGKPYTAPIPISKSKPISSYMTGPRTTSNKNTKAMRKIEMTDNTILNPEFAKLIREARMKKGLTHEQLGAQMNEKANLLRKLETGALKPDELFSKKLQRFLGIQLYVSVQED